MRSSRHVVVHYPMTCGHGWRLLDLHSYRLPENADRFATMQKSVPSDTFAFATDDDLDAVFAVGHKNTVLQFTYGQEHPVDTGTTFWDYVSRNLAEPFGDIELAWHTQLSFSTNREDDVIALLSRAFH